MLTTFFATLSLFFGFVAISSFSAHTSVYFMIITFLSTGILYYLLSCTYVSIMLFIVYVGAVAMLFVFCVMLLNLQSEGFVANLQYIAFTFALIFFFIMMFMSPTFSYIVIHSIATSGYSISDIIIFGTSLPFLENTTNFVEFSFSPSTKDVTFLSSFYSQYVVYIVFLGILLFFVTVAVTLLIG